MFCPAFCHTAPIIGHLRAPLSQKFGTPRQPNLVALTGIIEMIAPFDTPAAFVGLDDFSHLWLSWQFHHNFIAKKDTTSEHKFRAQIRPPRLGGNQKIGVFASRSMYRPSGLGLSVVKLERVEILDGRVLLLVSGADMIDGTPIIDIKPYVAYSDAIVGAKSGFAPSEPTPLSVTLTDTAAMQFEHLVAESQVHQDVSQTLTAAQRIAQIQTQLVAADLAHIRALIAQDPRPAYRQNEDGKPFVMRYKSVDIHFTQAAPKHLHITAITKIA